MYSKSTPLILASWPSTQSTLPWTYAEIKSECKIFQFDVSDSKYLHIFPSIYMRLSHACSRASPPWPHSNSFRTWMKKNFHSEARKSQKTRKISLPAQKCITPVLWFICDFFLRFRSIPIWGPTMSWPLYGGKGNSTCSWINVGITVSLDAMMKGRDCSGHGVQGEDLNVQGQIF